MSKPLIDQLEFYPPFTGFPREGVAFLKRLKKNNNRDWFQEHKQEYEESVKLPMQSLVAELHPFFSEFAPDYDVHPKKSLFRIYRDVRFSSDKRPYKTHVAAHFVRRGKPKGFEGLGYYMHIEPGEVFLGAGIYMPSSDQLKKIRRTIAEQTDQFSKLLKNKSLKKIYGKIGGEKLKRIPQGFDSEHPMSEWLKHKQFFVGISLPERKIYSKESAKEAAKTMKATSPLVEQCAEVGRRHSLMLSLL